MLYHLFYAFRQELTPLNVVRYITFRTAVASLTALFLVLVLGPWMIERLRRLQVGQYIREEGPQAHQSKKGTPTMGGLLILAGIVREGDSVLVKGSRGAKMERVVEALRAAFGVEGA